MDKLLVYASFGQGHKQAAFALEKFLNAPCRNFLDFSPQLLKRLSSWGYFFISEYVPFLWKILFLSYKNSFSIFLLKVFHQVFFSSFTRFLLRHRPKTVVVTHFFPLLLLPSLKRRNQTTIIAIVTDMRVHRLWVHPCVDFYCVAHQEGKNDLLALGIREDKIISGVIPIREGFLAKVPREKIRHELSFDHKPVILFMSSSRGRFPFIREVLPLLKERYNSIVIYGRNKKLKDYIQRMNTPSVKAMPFCEKIWEVMAISSVIVSKPGGLTVFEGIYQQKPFVFTHYIPGQEKANMDLLIKYGIARWGRNKETFMAAIDFFAQNEKRRQEYPLQVRDIREAFKERFLEMDGTS